MSSFNDKFHDKFHDIRDSIRSRRNKTRDSFRQKKDVISEDHYARELKILLDLLNICLNLLDPIIRKHRN